MDYLAVSQAGRRPGEAWRRAEAGAALGITRRGTPIALVVGLEMDEAEVLRAYRAARFGAALKRLQDNARATGASRLTDEQIQAEIDAVRREHTHAISAADSDRSGEL